MHHFSNLLFSIFKYLIVSLFVTLLSFLATASFISGKFPPSWQQLKNVKKNFENVITMSRHIMEKTSSSNPLDTSQRASVVGHENVGKSNINYDVYNDPALDDVKEVIKQQKSNAALIPENSGEISFSSSPPPSNLNSPKADPKIEERIRKLEEVVAHLHEQVRTLNEQILEQRKTSSMRH